MAKFGMIPNILIGGSSGVLLLVILFGFGGKDTYYDVAIYIVSFELLNFFLIINIETEVSIPMSPIIAKFGKI